MYQELYNKIHILEKNLKQAKDYKIGLEKDFTFLKAQTKSMKNEFQEAIGSWKRHSKGIKKHKLHREQLTKDTLIYKVHFYASKSITNDESAIIYVKKKLLPFFAPGYSLDKVIGFYKEEHIEWFAILSRNTTLEEQTIYQMEEL